MAVETKKRVVRTVLAAFGIIFALVLLYVLHPPCLIRSVFHVQCPACGTTRMITALLHLDFAAAWRLNPFTLFFLPFTGVWLILEAARYIRGKAPLLLKRFGVVLWALWLFAALLFGILRNLIPFS